MPPIPPMPPIPTDELRLPPLVTTPRSYMPSVGTVVGLLTDWHNDTHPGHFMFCTERPCVEIAREVR